MQVLITDINNWDSLKKKIKETLKFNCADYSDKFLARRVEVRLRALNLSSYLSYIQVLDKDFSEREKLLKELTIHVTHFFSDIDFYNAFENEVIPEIIKEKNSKNQKSIRVWSAGCSTGEEPYSIVICFARKLGKDFAKYDIKVLGTDYDANTVMMQMSMIMDMMKNK